LRRVLGSAGSDALAQSRFAVACALILLFGWVPRVTEAQSWCKTCEVQVGIGGTYHYWGTTGGVVLPVTVKWDDSRYELGFFRVMTQQVLYDSHSRYGRIMADPYWGASLSRRWRLYERGPVRGFVGFGFAAKTESDQLSCTRLDFAEQLGVGFRFPGDRVIAELTMRHWSNAGIRLPNHGQDFAMLTIKLNTGRFGIDKAERMAVDGLSRQGLMVSLRSDDSGGRPEWSVDRRILANFCCAAPAFVPALKETELPDFPASAQVVDADPLAENHPAKL
jgi:hypothetical protein